METLNLQSLDHSSLWLNLVVFGSISRVLEQVDSDEMLMGILRKAFHAVTPESPAPVQAVQVNLLGLAIEHKMNIAAMLEDSDKILADIKAELSRRDDAPSQTD